MKCLLETGPDLIPGGRSIRETKRHYTNTSLACRWRRELPGDKRDLMVRGLIFLMNRRRFAQARASEGQMMNKAWIKNGLPETP